MSYLKRFWPDALMVVIFTIISFVYFFPADTEGRILFRHDSAAGRGMGQETSEYYQRTGERSRWTNALFSGMPTYQSSPAYDSSTSLSKVMEAYHLWLPENVWFVFAYLLGFYIMLRAFDFRWYLASLGAIVWAFSSYFFIIIAAGHIWKVMALAYLPPMIGGILLAYKGKYLPGFVVTGIFTAFEVNANHVQMTYYYLFIILFLVIGFLVDAIREKRYMHFVKASAVCLLGAMLGVGANVSNLYHTWEYQKETMRGKSELVKENAANQTSSGLDRDYITQWSYGLSETWTLLVPNTKGGASNIQMTSSDAAMEKADPMYLQIYQQLGQYWGNQPGTSGPVYVGAFVLMLFVLGLFIVKGSMKWALLAATILSILLSWGRNFMPMTDFFLDYIPMYAKFRTVASILVIAEFTIPLLAMMALKKFIEDPDCVKCKRFPKLNFLYLSLALTGGVALLFALFPTLFFDEFVSVAERNAMSQIPEDQLYPLLANLKAMRVAIFTADCWRTVVVIALGFAALIVYKYKKLSAPVMVGLLAVLCIIDMWSVNKRYLNDDMFVSNTIREAPQEMTETDKQILQDKSLDYRVLNFASNTFNENETSYFHKSIGGYHAAKLRRYQELIEAHIAPEMQSMMHAIVAAEGDMYAFNGDSVAPVINMLNAKYFIFPMQGGHTMPILNPRAMGNAWFVSEVKYVDNANEELDALGKTNLRTVAVADKQFKDVLGSSNAQDSTSMVKITSYEPNVLTYDVNSKAGGVLVFSEIYYPGWTATVDGESVELGRVNYVLRAMNIKAGSHKVQLEYRPKSISNTETIAYSCLGILLVACLGGIGWNMRKRKA
ncbi:MAG: YfhO family protein [Prevotella sp.]|nr:YfhO family protein [Prevotella sp.]